MMAEYSVEKKLDVLMDLMSQSQQPAGQKLQP